MSLPTLVRTLVHCVIATKHHVIPSGSSVLNPHNQTQPKSTYPKLDTSVPNHHNQTNPKPTYTVNNKLSWSNLIKNKQPKLALKLINPSFDDNTPTLPSGSSVPNELMWENTLVVHFIDR